MQVKIITESVFDFDTLHVSAGVRYWEDSTVNGVEDTEGTLISCREDDYWCPIIHLETGRIINWEQGKTAEIHYKVCDDGDYYLKGEGVPSYKYPGNYVPSCLCPKENGFGDYIIMDIDADGMIKDWKFKPEGFVINK